MSLSEGCIRNNSGQLRVIKAEFNKNISPHTLRHSFATDIYRETSKINLVQNVLGHSDLSTTMIYTSIFDKEKESYSNYSR